MLPESLSSPGSNVSLRRFDVESDSQRVSLLLLDERVWVGGFDANGFGAPATLEEASALVEERYRDGDFYSVWVGDVWVGTTGILGWDCESCSARMGRTLLSPGFWGQGVNIAVKALLFEFLFSFGVEYVTVLVASGNRNSLNALRKFGFVELSRSPREDRYGGVCGETILLSLSRQCWEAFRDSRPVPEIVGAVV